MCYCDDTKSITYVLCNKAGTFKKWKGLLQTLCPACRE